jgi:cell division protein ZapA|tara:strand:+ start:417 stop:686 length:270 start_codon:yes stop_codon:yes gene_type:complete
MSEMETLSLRIFGRDLTLACPPEEKDQLINAAKLLNDELDSINDKNNALVIAGLSMASKLLNKTSSNDNQSSANNQDIEKLIEKIESVL